MSEEEQQFLSNDQIKDIQNCFDSSDEEETEDFDPTPYAFVLKDGYGNRLCLPDERVKHARVLCPQFYALLDHTLAVLWIMYSRKNMNKLGPCQIHWAWKFLEGLKRKHGYGIDVEMAISHLQDALMDATANLDESALFEEDTDDKKPGGGEETKEEEAKEASEEKSDETKKPPGDQSGGQIDRKIKIQSLLLQDMFEEIKDSEVDDILFSFPDMGPEEMPESRRPSQIAGAGVAVDSKEAIKQQNAEYAKAFEQLKKIQDLMEQTLTDLQKQPPKS